MPNRDVHFPVGAIAGGGYALYMAQTQPRFHIAAEIVGGVLGGIAGGLLPDKIDAPTCPRHRAEAHSVAFTGAAGKLLSDQLPQWQNFLRSQADRYALMRAHSSVPLEQFFLWMAENACRVLAGAIAGLLAGYASHLILDSLTPMSLPLFC